MNGPKGRVVAFVDGFNVYYPLKEHAELAGYKWLDYWRLCASVLPKDATLAKVFYFTALYNMDPDGVARHRTYIRALQSVGVETVYGKFKRKDRTCWIHRRNAKAHLPTCANCDGTVKSFEEKQTDVNIAVRLLVEAHNDTFDTALVVTGDTDLIPVIVAMHNEFPGKRVGFFFPPHRTSQELKAIADFTIKMKTKHLSTCQFPDKITLKDGSIIERPSTWRP